MTTPPPSAVPQPVVLDANARKAEKIQQIMMRDVLYPLQAAAEQLPPANSGRRSLSGDNSNASVAIRQLPAMPFRPDSGKTRSGVAVYTPREEDYVPPRPSTVGTTLRGKPYNTYHQPNANNSYSGTSPMASGRPPRNLPALSTSMPELSTLKNLLADHKAALGQQQQAYEEHSAHKEDFIDGMGMGKSNAANVLQRRNTRDEKEKLKASKKSTAAATAAATLRDQVPPPSFTEQFYGESVRKYRAEKGMVVSGEEPYGLYDDRAYKGRITDETVGSSATASPVAMAKADGESFDLATALRHPGKCNLKAMLGIKSVGEVLGLNESTVGPANVVVEPSDDEEEAMAAAEDQSAGKAHVEVRQLEDRPASRQLIEAYETGEAAANLRLHHFGIKESEGMVATIFGYSPTRQRISTHTPANAAQSPKAAQATSATVVPRASAGFTVKLHHRNILEQPTVAPSTTAEYYPTLRPPLSPEEAFDARGCPAIYNPPTLARGEEGDSPYKKPGEVTAEIILTYKSARRRQHPTDGESPKAEVDASQPQSRPPPSAGPLGHSTIDGRPRPTTSDDPFKVVDIEYNDDEFPVIPTGEVEDMDLAAINDGGDDDDILTASQSAALTTADEALQPKVPILEDHNAELTDPAPTQTLQHMQLELDKYTLEDSLRTAQEAKRSLLQSREAVVNLRNASRDKQRDAIQELATVEQQLQNIIVKAAPIYGEQRRREEAASRKADPRLTVHNKQTAEELWEGNHKAIEDSEIANRKGLATRERALAEESTNAGYLSMRTVAIHRIQSETEPAARAAIEVAYLKQARVIAAIVKEGLVEETTRRTAIRREELDALRSLTAAQSSDKNRAQCSTWMPSLLQAHERYDKHLVSSQQRPTTVAGGLQRPAVGALDADALATTPQQESPRPHTAEDEMNRRRREHFDVASEAYRQRLRQGWEQDRADREQLLQLQREKLNWKQEKRKLKKDFFEACAAAEILPSDVEAATANGAGDGTAEGNTASAWVRAQSPASPSRPTTALTDADDAVMQYTTGQSPKHVWEYEGKSPKTPAKTDESDTVASDLPTTPRRQEVLRLRQRLEYVQWAIDDVEQKEEALKRRIFKATTSDASKQ
eukprot:GILI01007208.1.p1 GENE.GILI01007208.1~~GILI01007208.1.p1  ORF type:complete len:1175 (-),score=255.73 GILI01007208.1:222-3563(-)